MALNSNKYKKSWRFLWHLVLLYEAICKHLLLHSSNIVYNLSKEADTYTDWSCTRAITVQTCSCGLPTSQSLLCIHTCTHCHQSDHTIIRTSLLNTRNWNISSTILHYVHRAKRSDLHLTMQSVYNVHAYIRTILSEKCTSSLWRPVCQCTRMMFSQQLTLSVDVIIWLYTLDSVGQQNSGLFLALMPSQPHHVLTLPFREI